MEENDFCALNMADRDRIRRQVIDVLKQSGYDEGAMKLEESFALDTEEGEISIPIEVLVHVDRKPALLVKCVRGNMATRERPSLSLARLLLDEPIPFAVVTTETEAVVFDTLTGKTVGRGYGAFPSPTDAKQRLRDASGFRIPPEQKEREKRILHTYYHLRCTTEMEPF
jgi:hypothetical protein